MSLINGRLKRALASGAAAIASKGISSISLLVAIRLAAKVATGDRYGAWLTLVTISSFLLMLDLGFGYSLLNYFNSNSLTKDKNGISQAVSSAFFCLSGLSILFLIVIILLYFEFPLSAVLNAEGSAATNEISNAVLWFGIVFFLSLPLSLLRNINSGMQQGYRYSVIEGFSALIGLILFIFSIYKRLALPELTVSLSCVPLITGCVAAYAIFFRDYPWMRPRLSLFNAKIVRHLLTEGVGFLLLQITSSIMFYMDGLLIARLFGLDQVANYLVPQQMYSLILMTLGFLLLPFWPAYRDALSSGDLKWTYRVARTTTTLTALASTAAAIIMFLFCDNLIQIWTGKEIVTSLPLRAGFSIALVLYACGSAYSMLLNALSFVYLQAILSVVGALVSIFAKILLSSRFGLEGIVFGNVFSYVICIVIPHLFLFRIVSAKLKSHRDFAPSI